MKKRLLSMLLLAVMLVTAVPLGALTVFATDGAEEPSFDEKDYNALYVQDGLFFAADFFTTGSAWGGAEATLKATSSFAPYVWCGTGSLEAAVGGTAAGGKLSLATDKLTVKPAGMIAATDTDASVEYVMDATALGTKPFYLRGWYLDSASSAYDETAGLSYELRNLYRQSNGTKSWSNGGAGWVAYVYDSFTLSMASWPKPYLPLSLGKGINTYTLAFAFADYMELTLAERDALVADAATAGRTPGIRLSVSGVPALTVDVPGKSPAYTDPAYVGKYRIVRWPSDSTEGKKGVQLEGFYDTKAEADAAIATLKAADEAAGESYGYRASQYYDMASDLNCYGVQANTLYAAGWTDYLGDGNAFTGDVYAIRYYDRALTPDEMKQNHFADLAKYYKVDLSGFAGIDEDLILDVYKAVADVKIGDEGAADAVRTAIATGVADTYGLLKVDGQEARNAFIDVAAGLMADLDLVVSVLSSMRPMEPVYEAIVDNNTASAYTTDAAFEEDVRALYASQYFYGAYKGENEDLNAFLAYAETAGLAIEELMSVPFDDRVAFATANKGENGDFAGVTQDTVDAYAAEVLARYADFLPEEYAYDTLYVQDGLVGQIDFFKLNPYWADLWSDEAPAPAMPVAPYLTEAFDSVTERLDMTQGYLIVAYGDDEANGVLPPTPTDDDPLRAAERYVFTYTGKNDSFETAWQHSKDLTTAKVYATREEAEAALAALKADDAIKAAILPEKAKHPYSSWPNPDKDGYQAISYGVYYVPVLNADYKAAVSKYVTEVNKTFAKFYVAGGVSIAASLPEVSAISSHEHDGTSQRVSFELAAGYMQHRYFSGQSFLRLNGVPASGPLTAELVMTAGEKNSHKAHGSFFIVSDAAPYREADEGKLTFRGFGGYNGLGGHTLDSPITLGVGLNDAVTYTTLVNRGAKVKTALYADGLSIIPEKEVNDSTATNVANILGYGTSSESRVYAIRYYQKSLSTAEMAQNHFADVAKYFRLEISTIDLLSPEQKAEVYAAFKGVRLTDDVAKKDLQALYDKTVGACYYDTLTLTLTKDADLNRQFLALAKLVGMDVTVLEGVDADSFEPVARDILARFDPAFAQNKAVVASYTDNVLKPYSAVTFAGYQIRVDSGAAAANTAGVRAVFDVDTALLAKLSAKGAITFGVKVFAKGADESHAELKFTYNAETGAITGENLVTGYEPEAVAVYERTVDGLAVTSFNYSVVFPNEALTEENLLAELVYKYYVTVGENTYTVTAQSARFGESVSAAEVYRHFATMDKYADDRMVAEVLAVLDAE